MFAQFMAVLAVILDAIRATIKTLAWGIACVILGLLICFTAMLAFVIYMLN